MDIFKAIKTRRTIRKFKQEKIDDTLLESFVEAARLAPSAANLQPLEFVIVRDVVAVEEMFKLVKWAGYIAPAGDPKEGERPVAYLVIVSNAGANSSFVGYDTGAAAMSVILTAWESGIGTCWIKAFNKELVRDLLSLPPKYEPDSVLALGYKAEDPVLENMDETVKYWKDETGVLHVPKRKLNSVIHWERFE